MRGSIFHGAPMNGPSQTRSTLADMPKDAKPKAEAAPRPSSSFGFGAPRAAPPPARVHVHVPGENYNDYLSTEDKPAATSTPTPTEPTSFVDSAVESYSESMAVDLKRTNAYSYADDDSASDTTGGYTDEGSNVANPSLASAAYSNDSQGTGGYTDDSQSTGGYADDAPSTVGYTGSSATISSPVGYTNDSSASTTTGGYTDDDATPGYSDDSSTGPTPSAASYIDSSTTTTTGGYSDDASTTTGGYSDDASGGASTAAYIDSSTTDDSGAGYVDDSAPSVPVTRPAAQNAARVTITPLAAPRPAAPSSAPGYTSGGYTDDESTSAGYTADASTGTGGYTDDSTTAASTAAYSDDTSASTAAYTDDSATASYSDSGNTGGYSDDGGATAGYVDSTISQSSAGATSSAQATTASYTDSGAGYSDSGAGYADHTQSSTTAGYADDSTAGYSNDSQSGGYSDDTSSAGYSEGGANAPADPFKAVGARSAQATYAGSNPASYSTGSEAGYSGNDSVGYGSGASDIGGYNNAAPAPVAARPAPPKPAADGSRDWNEEFQQSIAEFRSVLRNEGQTSTHVLQACHDLYQLSLDFIATAQDIGRTIIEEVSIPAPTKTIKPANVGGIAGGEKYVVKGIFFKFAIDAFGVYGGDEFAQKAAGHELAGLKAYYNCTIDGLNTPFMLLMDYRGYRLIATTKLPLSSASLIYGSADGGITVHKDDNVMNEMMKQAAAKLNIKPHVVGMRNQTDTLYAPTDIEGHKGGDGRYYVLDTARICPPEPVHKSFTAVILPPEDPFPVALKRYQLYSEPNADARSKKNTGDFWTPWPALREVGLTTERWLDQIYAHLGIVNNGTVVAASEEFGEGLLYHIKQENMLNAQVLKEGQNRGVNVRASNLVNKVIHGPALLVLRGRKGAQLFNLLRYETVKRNEVALSSDAFTPFGKHNRDAHNEEVENCFYDILSRTIPEFLNTSRLFPHAAGALKAIQEAGINTRMIGFLRSGIHDTMPNAIALRAWLLNEMIVRVTKNYLRSKLRKATLKLKPIEPIIIKRFNLLLGASTISSFFWATEMKAQIVNKFGRNGQALTPSELKTDEDLRTSVNKLALFQLLQSKIGVVFTEEANGRFQVLPARFEVPNPLSEKDLSKLTVLQKSLLQPELDDYILRAAVKASNNNPEKMLELSGQYLPQASAHPAIALQRLHIAEKLLMDISARLGSRFMNNFLYTSNMGPVVHVSESSADYLRAAKPQPLNQRVDGSAFLMNEALIDFLQSMPEYGEVLSHLEVLRIWVESTPYCPLEITCKLFYLRGCLAFVHRLWNTAEAFLKTSYDIITRVTRVPGAIAKQTYANGWATPDNDRPFSLLILDRLINVLLIQDRHIEALAFSEKFIRQLVDSSFPGTYADLKPVFGPSVPIAFSVYRTMVWGRNHISNVMDPFERELLKSKVVNAEQLAAWKSRVFVTNFSELSGFFMSQSVFQQYLDEAVYLTSTAYPYFAEGAVPWSPQPSSRDTSNQNKLDLVIRAPPVFVASKEPRDIRVAYVAHPNRFLYPELPVKLVLCKGIDYVELTKGDRNRRYFVDPACIIAEHTIVDPGNFRGSVLFKNVVLDEIGPYMALIIDGKRGLLVSVTTMASQLIQVISPETTAGPIAFAHDHASNYWSLLRNLPTEHVEYFAISDSDYESLDGVHAPANVILQDTSGRVWSTTEHNWQSQPIGLLRNAGYHGDAFTLKWSLVPDFVAWKVKKVALSVTHTLVLTDNGEVLSMGRNECGELGHGDTVTQTDPRLVRRLKGKQITNIFASEDISAALDAFGTIYQCGEGFTTLPEPHPYFSGKSASSKGKVIAMADVIFQSYQIESRSSARRKNDTYRKFFESRPVVYLSLTGQAFIWAPNDKFFGKDYEPEIVTTPSEPIIDAAIGERAMAFLTQSGAVYTAGTNKDGELGIGYGSVSHEMTPGAYHADVPYGCAQKVLALAEYKIISLHAAQTKFFALSDMGDYFEWGARVSWLPHTPTALHGLRATQINTGLRGAVVIVHQQATLPLPPNNLSIEVGFQQEAAQAAALSNAALTASSGGDGATAAGSTPTPKDEIAGTMFKIEYVELPSQPDFELHVAIPKTKMGTYYLRIVSPGETEKYADVFASELHMFMEREYELTILAHYEDCRWGTETVANASRSRPPLKAGDYEALIITKGDHYGSTFEDTTIHYRSPKFTVRPRISKYTLSVIPERPAPTTNAEFKIDPPPAIHGNYFYICIRPATSPTTTYGMIVVQADTKEFTWLASMPGKYTASFEYSINPSLAPLDVYATVEFTVGTSEADAPLLELEAIPNGPYYKGQSVILDWKYKKNPPKAGVTVYGGAYKASDKGMAAMMQGAYAAVTAAEGMSTITLPMIVDEFEYRVNYVVPGSGIETIATLPLNIIADDAADLTQKKKALEPAPPAPVESVASSSAPSADGSVPSSSHATPDSGAGASSSNAAPSLVVAPSLPADLDLPVAPVGVPTFESWPEFFDACGIDKDIAVGYSRLCKAVPLSKLPLIDGGVLISLKILDVHHQLAILEKIQEIRRAEMMIWFGQTLGSYAGSIAPALD